MRELRAMTEVRERVAERVPRWFLGLAGGHVAIIAVVLTLAVAAAAVLVVRSRPVAEAVPDVSGQTRLTSATGPAREPATATNGTSSAVRSPTDPTASGRLLVHVAGKVRDPGVVELPAGSRVLDAIEAAGGARDGVDLRGVNLARALSDGEQVLVGIPQELGAPPEPAAQPDGGGDAEPAEPIDLNAATAEQLEALPGIGPVLAERLLDYRAEHGRFSSVDELLDVSGIGEATFADLEPRVTVGR